MINTAQEMEVRTSGSLYFPPPHNYISWEHYTGRQRYLRSYPFTRKEDNTVRKKIKKWFKTTVEKSKNIESKTSRLVCSCGKSLSKQFFLCLSQFRPLDSTRYGRASSPSYDTVGMFVQYVGIIL